MSDYDIAVCLAAGVDAFRYRMRLLEGLNRLLGTDRVDLVILDEAPVLLRHRVIRDGALLKEHHESRVRFESRTLREYLDTAYLRRAQVHSLSAFGGGEAPDGR